MAPILVTGAGRRLGYSLAMHLLSKGYSVIALYRSDRPEISTLEDAGADVYQCDFYNEAQVLALIHSIRDNYQSLRAVVHNASDWMPDSWDFTDVDVLSKMMQVHVTVPYQMNIAFEPLLNNVQNEHADIIHISDYVAERGSQKHVAYAASKAALSNMCLSFAAKFSPRIKVNCIAPALLLFNEADADAYKQKALTKSVMNKEGGVKEYISAVDYLLESSFVTGRTIHLDGGRHIKS